MALTRKEVLSDAGNLATEFVDELSPKGLTFDQNNEAMQDAINIFSATAEILTKMMQNKKRPTVH